MSAGSLLEKIFERTAHCASKKLLLADSEFENSNADPVSGKKTETT